MKRWVALALLLMLPFTLAPRTSDVLENGWSYSVHTGGAAKAGTSTYVANVWRDTGEDATAVLRVAVEPAGAWALVSASPGCAANLAANVVSCLVTLAGANQKKVITLTVRTTTTTTGPAAFSLSSVGTTG